MTRVEQELRTVLHGLPPEPPDELATITAVRARAGRVRRAQAVASALGLALVVAAAGLALPRGGSGVPGWAGLAPAGSFPNWQPRGELAGDPIVDRAVATWRESIEIRERRPHRLKYSGARKIVGAPRLLYAGGKPAVVVLHAVTAPGGERLVVVKAGHEGNLYLYTDAPAPDSGTPALTLQLDDRSHAPPPTVCKPYPLFGPSTQRLLVLGDAGVRAVRWLLEAELPEDCPADLAGARSKAHDVRLRQGVGFTDVRIGSTANLVIEVRGDRPYAGPPTDSYGHRADVFDLEIAGTRASPYFGPTWRRRTDHSRAEFTDLVPYTRHRKLPCANEVAMSLPDGTPAWLHTCRPRDDKGVTVHLLAEDAGRQMREYLDEAHGLFPPFYAAVVDGFTGRWLVVTGPHELASATYHDGHGGSHRLEVRNGVAVRQLGQEPGATASIESPIGTTGIHDTTGYVVPRN